MQTIVRVLLRPTVLGGRGSTHASAAAAVSAASGGQPAQASPISRHWSSSAPNEAALAKAERMVELMGQSPQLQQMMLGVMPAPMRNPEVLKQLFGDPSMRRRIAEMIASRGMTIPDHLLERMSPSSMDDTFARAQRLGLDPGALFTKLMSHPGLLAALQQPRVMAAFLDIAEDPSRQAKYEEDKELLDVVFKVREIMGTTKTPPAEAAATGGTTIPVSSTISEAPAPGATVTVATTTSSVSAQGATPVQVPPPGQPPRHVESERAEEASASTSSTSNASSSDAGGSSTVQGASSSSSGSAGLNPLVILMSSDPKAARWLQNPQVMAALEEVHRSPWKTVKYIFNREVMEAFQDLKKLLRGQKL